MAAKIVSEKKGTETKIEPKEQEEQKDTTQQSSEEVTLTIQPEPVISPALPEIEDWRMNREWCLNQAMDIVKSLKFEVKDVPAFLEEVYRKIIELANDARRGKKS
jgi:hypothetical protein